MKRVLVADPRQIVRDRLSLEVQECLRRATDARSIVSIDVQKAALLSQLPKLISANIFNLIIIGAPFLDVRPTIFNDIRNTLTNEYTPILLLLDRSKPDALLTALDSEPDDVAFIIPFDSGVLRKQIAHWSDKRVNHWKSRGREDSALRKETLRDMQQTLSVEEFQTLKVATSTLMQTFSSARKGAPMPFDMITDSVQEMRRACVNGKITEAIIQLGGFDEAAVRHSFQVAMLAGAFGEFSRCTQEECLRWWVAGLLHDIGRVRVPTEVLTEAGELSPEQWEEMKKHPSYGGEILRGSVPSDVHLIALQHHERIDGSGYPRGLVAREIDPAAQLIGLIDAFEAMTNERPHRVCRLEKNRYKAMEAIGLLASDVGKFDPEMIRRFSLFIEACRG